MRAIMKRLRRDESGLSMTEILVSMLLTSILLAAAAGMMIQISKITVNSNQTQNSTKQNANVANAMTTVIRMGTQVAQPGDVLLPAVAAGTRSSLTVYSNTSTDPLKPGPTRVTWSLCPATACTATNVAGDIVEERCVAKESGGYWSFATCASSVKRTIGQGFLAPGATYSGKTAASIFTYLDANNVPIAIGNNPLTDAQRQLVAGVVVETTVQAPGSKTAPSIIRNTVVLRNLGLGTSDE
jgi:Tfp pilus assembly protein PilV